MEFYLRLVSKFRNFLPSFLTAGTHLSISLVYTEGAWQLPDIAGALKGFILGDFPPSHTSTDKVILNLESVMVILTVYILYSANFPSTPAIISHKSFLFLSPK